MKVFDLTMCARVARLEDVVQLITLRFGGTVQLRSSSYLGGDYLIQIGLQEALVHWNRDGDEIAEQGYAEFPVLLQVIGCEDTDPWKSLLASLHGKLIRETKYDDDR